MIYSIPNILTLLRIALIPVFVGVFYLPWQWSNLACAAVFGLAAGTDWLDGYLARRLGQTSPLGAFLDPVADKLMVAAALILLVEADPTPALAVPVVIIIGREITISALREWMATIGARANVKVSVAGKIKTTLQMIGIAFMVYQSSLLGIDIYSVGFVFLIVAAGMTLWSMMIYLRAAWPFILLDEKSP